MELISDSIRRLLEGQPTFEGERILSRMIFSAGDELDLSASEQLIKQFPRYFGPDNTGRLADIWGLSEEG